MTKTIVIIGGSFAGLHIAHYLLKLKIPDTKVILVSKSTHFFWCIASVRAIVPGQIKDEQLFQPLAAALERYSKESYELLIGSADKVDTDAKTVLVGSRTLSYDQLVLATGARCTTTDVPWKLLDTYEETKEKLHSTTERVKTANHIVVAGAGATGVEVAGELGFEYGKTKEIWLLSSSSELMGGDTVGVSARNELEKLNVKIKVSAKVTETSVLPDGKTEVSLHNGEKITTDLYLPTMGVTPNSEYVDVRLLDERKFVVVDEMYRVKGAADVWAAGDIVSKPRAGFLYTQKQAAGVGKNIEAVLKGKEPSVVKLMPFDIVACAVGRSRGAGRMGSVKMLSLMVWLAKGRTLSVQTVPSYIDGSVA